MTFSSDIHAALDQLRPADVTGAVHELVANALSRLDPTVEIKRTDYFNHSFVPDLVLRWGTAEQRQERYVHLRFSVIAEPFAEDLKLLGEASPVFVGMTDKAGLNDAPWRSLNLNGTLVTQTSAVDDLQDAVRKDARTRRATEPLVRLGRGLLDEPTADHLGDAFVSALRAIESETPDPQPVRGSVGSALEAFRALLPEEGEVLVERALQSEWISQGRDPHDFPGRLPWRPELLDRESLREVLWSLLRSERPVEPETWQRNAGFIRAEDIGVILGRDIRGGTFNTMAHALLPNWTAKWAWASRSVGVPLFETYQWLVSNGLLGLEVNDLEVFFADDGRHFKDKEGGNPLPRLSETQDILSEPGVQTVGLRGTQEGIRYEPLGGVGLVYERLQQVLAGPGPESYRVQSVTTTVPGTDWVADLDFDRQVIDLRGQPTPIAQLGRIATRFFSRAQSAEGLDHFLATGMKRPDG
jgi:hypothetical protein